MVGAGAGGLGRLLYWLGRGASSCAIGWRPRRKGKPPAAAPFPEGQGFPERPARVSGNRRQRSLPAGPRGGSARARPASRFLPRKVWKQGGRRAFPAPSVAEARAVRVWPECCRQPSSGRATPLLSLGPVPDSLASGFLTSPPPARRARGSSRLQPRPREPGPAPRDSPAVLETSLSTPRGRVRGDDPGARAPSAFTARGAETPGKLGIYSLKKKKK